MLVQFIMYVILHGPVSREHRAKGRGREQRAEGMEHRVKSTEQKKGDSNDGKI